MTTRKKWLIYLLLAIIVNFVLTISYFLLFLWATLYFGRDYLSNYGSALLLLPLVASFIASFFSHQALVKWVNRKFHLEQKLRR